MNKTIFVSVAAYLDPMLLFTVSEIFSKAKFPANIRVGIVDQHVENHHAKLKEFPYASQVRYLHLQPRDTYGVSWARSIAFTLYDNEDYFLQIDSHTFFEQDWDEILINQLTEVQKKSSKPILSTYPHPFTMEDGIPKYVPTGDPRTDSVLVLRPKPGQNFDSTSMGLYFHARHAKVDQAVLGCHLAGGFIFTTGNFIEEVPYDPFLYFHGEEQSLAIRAYTHGWDIYHPPIVPLRHLYKQSGVPQEGHHWHGDIAKQRDVSWSHLTDRAKKRLHALLSGKSLVGAYALGNMRTLDDFIKHSGIDYRNFKITDPFNGELK